MQFRELGNTGEKVSILGFGTMRLPTIKTHDNIDKTEASNILKYGIDNGINIIDTAYPYHGKEFAAAGKCEAFLGEFLKENSYREDILISTKSPSWLIEKEEDFTYYLDNQLKALQTDYIDVYMLHDISLKQWEKFQEFNVIKFLENAKDEGKINHIGLSVHCDLWDLAEMLYAYDGWEVCLTQMNYVDESYQTGLEGLEYLKDEKIGTMIMEPLRGGTLVNNIPQPISDIWDRAEVKRTPLEWALEYLWDMENVDCVLSGMNSLEQVKENIEIASKAKVNSISEFDKELIREVREKYMELRGNTCTGCNYCKGCPNNVDIVNCMKEYNIGKMIGDPKASAMHYFSRINKENRAENCTACGDCIPLCPQFLDIPDELLKVYEYFGDEFNHF